MSIRVVNICQVTADRAVATLLLAYKAPLRHAMPEDLPTRTITSQYLTWPDGDVAQMIERPLSMREVWRSMLHFSNRDFLFGDLTDRFCLTGLGIKNWVYDKLGKACYHHAVCSTAVYTQKL